jgi:hypothetical protein
MLVASGPYGVNICDCVLLDQTNAVKRSRALWIIIYDDVFSTSNFPDSLGG